MPSDQPLAHIMRTSLHRFHQYLLRVASPPAFQAEPIALLIDGENVSAELAVHLIATASTFGAVTIRRVYGNWAHSSMNHWHEVASHYAITPVHYQPPVSGKNATDIKLVVDAMDLYRDGLRRFCLASSDSDYTPLIQRLRELGCLVLGIGKPETSLVFQNACTVFISTHALLPPTSRSKTTPTSTPLLLTAETVAQRPLSLAIQVDQATSDTKNGSKMDKNGTQDMKSTATETQLQNLLQEAYTRVVAEEKSEWVPLSKLGSMLTKIDSSFKVKSHGSSSLKALIQKHNTLFQMQKNGEGHPTVRQQKEN
jgi:hypothetical protein